MPDDRDLLIGIEYVCHVYYCTPIIIACQVFLGYNFSVMKTFALAVLLVITQATTPAPRQAADSAAGTSKSIQADSTDNQAKTSKTDAAIKSESANNDEKSSDRKRSENTEQSVRVTEFPTVTVAPNGKDWMDYALWAFNFLLAVTSGFQVWLLCKTLTFVSRQTHEMKRQRIFMGGQLKAMQAQIGQMQESGRQTDIMIEATQKSANAAKVSADIAAGVSVPTLVIDEFDLGNPPGASLEAMLQFPTTKLVVKNYGQTPAFLRSWSVIFTCEELPEVPDYFNHPGCGIVLEKVVIQPNESYTFPYLMHWQRQQFSDDDVNAIMEKRKLFNVYGCVNYGDIFGNPIRRLKFCETALNLFPGNSPSIMWFSQLAPTAYRGTDLMPFAPWHGIENQTPSTNTKADDKPEKAN